MSDDLPEGPGPTSPERMPTRAAVLWFTGLSSSGKTTLAEVVAAKIRARGEKAEVLDGDAARATLSSGLGFSRADRDTHVLRLAYVAHLLSLNGVFVAVAAISPYRCARAEARAMIGAFVEIHVMGISEASARTGARSQRIASLRRSFSHSFR